MSNDRRPSASPVCSADEAPRDYMQARPLSRAELDGLLSALRRLEERLGKPERRAAIDRLATDPDAPPIETIADAPAAAVLIRRSLPLVADETVREALEELQRLYDGA